MGRASNRKWAKRVARFRSKFTSPTVMARYLNLFMGHRKFKIW